MQRSTVARHLLPLALPLASLLGCGSHDAGKSAASPTAAPAEAPAPVQAAAVPDAAAAAGAPSGAAPMPGGGNVPAPDVREPIATVNGKAISGERVEAAYRMNRSMLEQRGRPLTPADDQALRAQTLQSALGNELLYQAAVAKGVGVTGPAIEAAMGEIKKRAGSEEAYKKMLVDAGLKDSDVRAEIEHDLRTQAYRKVLVAGRTVSEADAKKYYDANAPKGMFNVPERVHIQYILVKAGEEDPEPVRAEARKRSDEAAKRAAAGEDFGALARQYSQDPSAARGGDVGLVPRGVMPPKLEEMAFSAKSGDVSSVLETPKGFYIIKVLEKKPVSTQRFDEVKNELMLEMSRFMEENIVAAKVKELAAGAKIAILDKSFLPPGPAVASGPTPPGTASKVP